MDGLHADRRLYLTADKGTAVEQDDPRAMVLLAEAGGLIAGADVARLGLTAPHGVVQLPRAAAGAKGKGK